MDEEVKREKEEEEFRRKGEELRKKDEAKTSKNKARREKLKAKKAGRTGRGRTGRGKTGGKGVKLGVVDLVGEMVVRVWMPRVVLLRWKEWSRMRRRFGLLSMMTIETLYELRLSQTFV